MVVNVFKKFNREIHSGILAAEADLNKMDEETAALLASHKSEQEKLSASEAEPYELEEEVNDLDDPIATAEVINFQFEREKRSASHYLEQDKDTLKNIRHNRCALGETELSMVFSNLFSKLEDMNDDGCSLAVPVDKDNELLSKVNDLRGVKCTRQSRRSHTPPFSTYHIPYSIKHGLIKLSKIDLKETHKSIMTTKLEVRRMSRR